MNSKNIYNVCVNDFVRRQVKGSGKTFSKSLSFNDIAKHAKEQMLKGYYCEGYREGVRVVQVNKNIVSNFVCPYVKITHSTRLVSSVVKRNNNEESYIQTRALNGKNIATGKVELILYRHDVLKENKENTTNAKWELISFNAIPKGLDSMPIGPVTMMRNQLCLKGGTKGFYSSEEWAKSVRFYQKYLPIHPDNDIL